MDTSTDGSARPGPKERTRRLLRQAAQELLRAGKPLTVAAVAELAGVSRATAYRYFPSNESVVLHATMAMAVDPVADTVPTAAGSPAELDARAAELIRTTAAWAFDRENELRTMLWLSLNPDPEARRPRRFMTNRDRWISALLDGLPSDVPAPARDRLAAALTPLFGSDAIVWTTDMAGLSRDQAVELLEWMARALIAATLNDWSGESPPHSHGETSA
ncbi:MAG TPA: TetR/AcrR family transcriptional regulator [Mycobacteriales bacterium]|nr:TetR/AcrR family transcriptional regulator [Mycobacteriales bacterium]